LPFCSVIVYDPYTAFVGLTAIAAWPVGGGTES